MGALPHAPVLPDSEPDDVPCPFFRGVGICLLLVLPVWLLLGWVFL